MPDKPLFQVHFPHITEAIATHWHQDRNQNKQLYISSFYYIPLYTLPPYLKPLESVVIANGVLLPNINQMRLGPKRSKLLLPSQFSCTIIPNGTKPPLLSAFCIWYSGSESINHNFPHERVHSVWGNPLSCVLILSCNTERDQLFILHCYAQPQVLPAFPQWARSHQDGEQNTSPATAIHSPLLENKVHRHFLYFETYTKLLSECIKEQDSCALLCQRTFLFCCWRWS